MYVMTRTKYIICIQSNKHALVEPSFIPPKEMGKFKYLTKYEIVKNINITLDDN